MLSLLTKYLIQHKKVCIPYVGMFEIVQQPPQLNVVDQIITPPAFTIKHWAKDAVPEHQFLFFASAENEKETIEQELFSFGERLKNKIQQSSFHWKGFGTLHYVEDEIIFEAEEICCLSLQNIAAQKVLRENAQHQVLVGDKKMSSNEIADALNQVQQKHDWYMIAGWTLLIIALLSILIILYFNHFEPAASGLHTLY